MKLKLAIDYSIAKQREEVVSVEIKQSLAKAMVQDVLNKMDYQERKIWITKNNVKVTSSSLI